MADSMLRWIHRDSRGLEAAVEAGFARAKSLVWSDDTSSTADLRALLLGVFGIACNLGPHPVIATGQGANAELIMALEPSTERLDNAAVQKVLIMGVNALILQRRPLPYPPPTTITVSTVDGEPVAPIETSGPQILLGVGTAAILSLGAVLVAGIVAGSLYLMFSEASEVFATHIATDATVEKHAAQLATSAEIVAAHLERERQQGVSLPWDPQELALIEQLRGSIQSLTNWQAPALVSVPDVKGAVKTVGASLSTGLQLGVVVVVGLVAWNWLKKE